MTNSDVDVTWRVYRFNGHSCRVVGENFPSDRLARQWAETALDVAVYDSTDAARGQARGAFLERHTKYIGDDPAPWDNAEQ